jgi:prevent-host-death family protein
MITKGDEDMTSISAAKARENIYKMLSDVNTDSRPITITNSRGKNGVLISENDWNAIQETLYLNAIPGVTESIVAGGNTPLEDCLPEDGVEW